MHLTLPDDLLPSPFLTQSIVLLISQCVTHNLGVWETKALNSVTCEEELLTYFLGLLLWIKGFMSKHGMHDPMDMLKHCKLLGIHCT